MTDKAQPLRGKEDVRLLSSHTLDTLKDLSLKNNSQLSDIKAELSSLSGKIEEVVKYQNERIARSFTEIQTLSNKVKCEEHTLRIERLAKDLNWLTGRVEENAKRDALHDKEKTKALLGVLRWIMGIVSALIVAAFLGWIAVKKG